jgi:sulfoxide reductase heme-binding subunit YedZ
MAVGKTNAGQRKNIPVWLVYSIGLAPAVWQFCRGATGNLGADPVKAFELFLGLWAIRFLILTLAVSPARQLFGLNFMRYRRALGLLCFYYASMHLAAYLVLDQALMLSAILEDVLKRPFIMLGMAAFVLLLPLALTSNSFSIRRLGRNWVRLHRLVYAIAICAGVHFALATKVLSADQFVYLGLIALLLGYRLFRPGLKPRRKRASNAAPQAFRPRVSPSNTQ